MEKKLFYWGKLSKKKIAEIAKHITDNCHKYHLVIVAGPSSSGKTTFTNKLAIALEVNGKKPIIISMDDYYLNRDQTPLGPDGEPDFEAVDAIDIPLFQKDLESLISGTTIPVPSFNFKTGMREYRGQLFTKEPGSPIIIEGIHGLNPRLTNRVPSHLKYMVYVTTLTQLNILINTITLECLKHV
ncbi:hypothetical protein AZF37_09435 [endosymbiont 'TC1' of Trimyema compressum]|uniref:nucleoside kinase n=1 Tax=endosymbiont 'TC1' of Trimyema compressum TaxID=243899 RepID=UPI0007F146B5|nr:nucleoside kinase [endosymbiont 'TC1' of Trimyema compressum]AMP21339.1 hypothetical protein AZF37_09435 [endosymbiont 'TC1' of Trimyema compressum]